jgi:hypothetical protein
MRSSRLAPNQSLEGNVDRLQIAELDDLSLYVGIGSAVANRAAARHMDRAYRAVELIEGSWLASKEAARDTFIETHESGRFGFRSTAGDAAVLRNIEVARSIRRRGLS